jgi:hypothetical protein
LLVLGYTSAGLLLSISTERLISLIGSPRKRAAIKKLLAEKSSTRRTRAIIYLALSAVGITAGITLGACTGRHQYKLRKEAKKPEENPAAQPLEVVIDAPPVHESRDGAGNPAHHRLAASAKGPVSLESDFLGGTSSASSRQSTPPTIHARNEEKERRGSQTPKIVTGHGESPDHSPAPFSPEAPDTGLSTSPGGAASVAINLYQVHFTAPTEGDLDTTHARHTEARRNIADAVRGLPFRSKSADSPRSRISRFIIPTDHNRSLLVATPAGSTESTPTPTPALTPVVSPEASPARAGAGVVTLRSPRFERDARRAARRNKRAHSARIIQELEALDLIGDDQSSLVIKNSSWLRKKLTERERDLLQDIVLQKLDITRFKELLQAIHQACIPPTKSVLLLSMTSNKSILDLLNDALEECPESSLDTSFRSPL